MEFRLAKPTDDDAIRQLLSEIPLDGTLKIRFQREPSFFKSIDAQGIPNQTVVGTIDGKVMAVASQNLQKVYINGIEKTLGYISNLRFHPNARNGISLIKGIRYFEEQSGLFSVDFHYATLIEKDIKIHKILASNRPRIPKFYDYGKVITYAIPLGKTKTKAKPDQTFQIKLSDEQLMPEILNFLNREGKQKNLFPMLDGNNYDLSLLGSSEFFVAYKNNEIVGVCSVSDLSHYKQYILEDYTLGFGLIRVPLNWFLALKKLHPIPSKNKEIKIATLGFIVVKNNQTEVFKSLVDNIYSTYSGTKFRFLTIALHQKDKLNNRLQNFPKIKYTSRLYLVKLKNNKFAPDDLNLEQNIPFIDLLRL